MHSKRENTRDHAFPDSQHVVTCPSVVFLALLAVHRAVASVVLNHALADCLGVAVCDAGRFSALLLH